MKKIYYQEMLPHELEAVLKDVPVAYVPLGTLEYHGKHLPVGNDALKAEALCRRACERTGGVLVPPTYWGIGGGHKGYPATIMMRDSLLGELLDDIFGGLYRVGFRIIVAITGHYPGEQVDAVKQAAERFKEAHNDAHILAIPEYEAFKGEQRRDHAAKWETSILMELRPELVEMDRLAGADKPGAPECTRNAEEMNAPGPLHGIRGENPALFAGREPGKETVDGIVDELVRWVKERLK